MTKKLFILCAALVWTVALVAQNISVVAANGSTKLYRTLQAAIEGADPNSTIYLPGGGFPIADSVKITKKLTIIGIGHKTKNDNVDGVTTISGNLFFNEGSSSSAVMGCYITGNVNIGENNAVVNDVLVKYCNLNSVQISNGLCLGTTITQNYVRGDSSFGSSTDVSLINNVIGRICDIASGCIKFNMICYNNYYNYGYGNSNSTPTLVNVNNTLITNNIFRYGTGRGNIGGGSANTTNANYLESGSYGDNPIVIDAVVDDIFVNINGWGISPTSDFHFKDEYKQYENQIGIYAGDGFNDKQLAPVPYIVAKKIDEQTDAAGKLNIKIRVKASGEE